MQIRIKDLLKEKKVTSIWLASIVGITQPSMSNIMNGKINPSLDTLEKIAAALNVPFIELFERPASGSIICPKCGTAIKLSAEPVSQ